MSLVLAVASATAGESTATADCSTMRWTTLGTAGGPIPAVDRSEPANLLTTDRQQILVDTGDGTVNQLAKIGLTVGAIQHVLISHHHLDHTGGLAAVIGLRWMNQFPGTLTVFGPPGTRELVDGIVASMQPQARVGFGLGIPVQPPASSVEVVEISSGQSINIGEVEVIISTNTHFSHEGPQPAMPPQSLSFRFNYRGRSITYTGDTGPSDAVMQLASRTDLLVSEVMDLEGLYAEIQKKRRDASPDTLRDLRRHLATHHLSAEDVGEMAARASVARVVLTHFAMPPYPLAESDNTFIQGVGQHFNGPVIVAKDLSAHEVACR